MAEHSDRASARPAPPGSRPPDPGGSGSTTDQARARATRLASEATEQTAHLAGQARQQVSSLVTEQKERAAERLSRLAGLMREAAAKLETDDIGGPMGQYATRAADRADSMSSYVRRSDVETLVQDVGRFGRRRPEVFLGGTFLTGLILARFLKASSRESRQPTPPAGGR